MKSVWCVKWEYYFDIHANAEISNDGILLFSTEKKARNWIVEKAKVKNIDIGKSNMVFDPKFKEFSGYSPSSQPDYHGPDFWDFRIGQLEIK